MVWNLPFEIEYRSMSPAGWPRLVIFCIGKNFSGKEIVKAYGSTFVPIEPGSHCKNIRMFIPLETDESSFISSFWSFFGYSTPNEGISSVINNP